MRKTSNKENRGEEVVEGITSTCTCCGEEVSLGDVLGVDLREMHLEDEEGEAD